MNKIKQVTVNSDNVLIELKDGAVITVVPDTAYNESDDQAIMIWVNGVILNEAAMFFGNSAMIKYGFHSN